MKCFHILSAAPDPCPFDDGCHWLDVAGGNVLLVHPNCDRCADPSTRMGHVMGSEPVGAAAATALSAFGVLATDTTAQALLKVAPAWPQAYP